jgi:hypothetical protein
VKEKRAKEKQASIPRDFVGTLKERKDWICANKGL